MGKENLKTTDRDYWLTINFYRWEFLRRSKEYRDFYKQIKTDYLIPFKKFEAALKKAGLNINRILASKLMPVGLADLVEQKLNLQDVHNTLSEEAYNKFGLSWLLMGKHYPKEMLNPNKKISRAAVVFADYQRYSPYYKDLVFQPHIKRITGMPSGDFERFRGLNPTYEVFAISTWGEPYISDEAMESMSEFIKETFKVYPQKKFVKNPFLLEPCKPIRGDTLQLQEKRLSEHWDTLLKTWDLIEMARKMDRTQINAMLTAAKKLNISFEAVRSRVRQARKLITEAAQARFYSSNTDIS
jgi:hypothetical protein